MNTQAFSKIWIVIIVVILIGGGILAWQYFKVPEEKIEIAKEEMIEIEKVVPVPEEMIEGEAVNWKTYRNEEYGFEIKFPIHFFVKKQKITPVPEETIPDIYVEGYKYEKPVRLLYSVEIYSEDSSLRDVDMGVEDFGIDIYDNANNLTVNEWIDYINKGVEAGLIYEGRQMSVREPLSILGIEAVKGMSGCCLVCLISVWIPKENKIYELSYRGFISPEEECPDYYNEKYGCCSKYETVFNQMLSTFRFLE